jgi:hypothetical protein
LEENTLYGNESVRSKREHVCFTAFRHVPFLHLTVLDKNNVSNSWLKSIFHVCPVQSCYVYIIHIKILINNVPNERESGGLP